MKTKLEDYFLPMLCEDGTVSDLEKKGYVGELKVDGTCCIAEYSPEIGFRLYGKRGLLYNDTIPEITDALTQIPNSFRFHGEIVYIDDKGHMIFAGSQKRCQVSNPKKVEIYRKAYPVGMFVFDMPMLNDIDLKSLAWIQRRQLLENFISLNTKLYNLQTIRIIPISYKPREMYERAIKEGYEGIVLKKMTSPYVQERSRYWLKVKVRSHTVYVLPNEGKLDEKV